MSAKKLQDRSKGVRRAHLTPLALLAVVGLPGCVQDKSNTSLESKANRASVTIDSGLSKGTHTGYWYRQTGDTVALSDRWIAEAQVATAETQAERSAAQAAM